MLIKKTLSCHLALTLASMILLSPLTGQTTETASATMASAQVKKPISHDVYANWRSINGSVLSHDGQWAAFALHAQEGDGEVVVRHLADGREWRWPRGTAPAFSSDGRYLAFAITPLHAELVKAKKDKKKTDDLPKPGLGIMDLANGKVETIGRVKRFAWPEQGASWLAVLQDAARSAKKDEARDAKAPQKGTGTKKEAGSEMMVLDFTNRDASAKRHLIQDVAEFVWAKNGERLAYTVSLNDGTRSKPKTADSAREGVYLFNPQDASSTALANGAGYYKHLSFDDNGQQLAFISNRDALAAGASTKEGGKDAAEGKDGSKDEVTEGSKDNSAEAAAGLATPASFNLFYWRAGWQNARAVVGPATLGMSPGWGIGEFAELHFSKDGQRLFFANALLPKPPAKDAPEPVKVDLWHWKDPQLQSMQKVRAEKEKQRSYTAVWHVASERMVQLANKDLPGMLVNDNARFALGISDLPYQRLQSWDHVYYDAYAVDLESGAARLLATKMPFLPSLSPAGKYMLAFDGASRQWISWAMQDGSRVNLTAGLKVDFDDTRRDTPDLHDGWGFAGWRMDDAAVVLYDQYDLWQVDPASHASHNLTQGFGRRNGLEFRYVNLAREPGAEQKVARRISNVANDDSPVRHESKPLPDQPWILATTHEATRASGFYALPHAGGTPQKLIFADKMMGDLIKAKDADAVLFTQQSFAEFPDLWYGDRSMQSVQKISQANPQQSNYNWGRQEVLNYTSSDGKKLKALLTRPEDFDPAKKYPLMVYVYEKFSDNLHRHIVPAPSQNINIPRYVSNGYIVLRPDIVYQTGSPGKSAVNTVLPAIRQLIAKGYVDPARIGIQGHSWGGYQVNYLLTQTKLFRAAEAGASMANMISGYGGIRWGSGSSRAVQYEKQQSRIGTPPWASPFRYIENSPIFFVDKITTPWLGLHNDDDDAVPWYQSIEFFTALRRLDKQAYWFSYNGEKHGLKERDNIKHFTVHMAEFFDHYLLGKARAEWMDTPVPYLEKGKRDVMGQFKREIPSIHNKTE